MHHHVSSQEVLLLLSFYSMIMVYCYYVDGEYDGRLHTMAPSQNNVRPINTCRLIVDTHTQYVSKIHAPIHLMMRQNCILFFREKNTKVYFGCLVIVFCCITWQMMRVVSNGQKVDENMMIASELRSIKQSWRSNAFSPPQIISKVL